MITYIIGTDTNAGKTYYGKTLAKRGLKVIKPIETGRSDFSDLNSSDCYSYSRIQNIPIEDINCYFFKVPASPHFASALDKLDIDLKKLKAFVQREDDVFVELAGGLMVPITKNYFQLDLIKDTKNAQVELVIGNKLGCLNHSILTIEMLKTHDVAIDKIIVNNFGLETTMIMQNNIDTLMDLYGEHYDIHILH